MRAALVLLLLASACMAAVPRVGVAPLRVYGAGEELPSERELRERLMNLLKEGSWELRPIASPRVPGRWDALICGSLTKVGETFSLDLQALGGAKGEVCFRDYAEGPDWEGLVKEVAARLRAALRRRLALARPAPRPPTERSRARVPAGGARAGAAGAPAPKGPPIEVQADRLEADRRRRTVTFEGHVVAKRGTMRIFAQHMRVHYDPRGRLERIVAEGDVRIYDGDRRAAAQRAEFLENPRRVILEGRARAWRGLDEVKGHRIVLFLEEERSVVEAPEGGRVEAVIHPR